MQLSATTVISDITGFCLGRCRHLIVMIIEVLFPDRCFLCSSPVSYRANSLCDDCAGLFVRSSVRDNLREEDRYIFYDRHCHIFDYNKNLLSLIYAFKNGGRSNLSRFFSSSIAVDDGLDFDLITWVPSSAEKMRKRGFCHTELLARQISRLYAKPCRLLLREKKRTQQKSLHFDNRFLNTINCFVYISAKLDGKTVLLIDDVLTTGATLNECARIIKKNGAVSVLSLTISRVPFIYQKNE